MASGEFPISAALLLINFSLLITWSAADECGTKFVDPSSSTVLAQIVVQGKVDTMIPVSHDVLSHSANVTIAKVYKGMDSLKEMGIPPGGNVMVEKFGPETDPDECVADMSAMTSEEDLLFFLRPSASHGVMQLTALPLPAEITVMATVERSLCATCVSPPKINRVMCRHCAHAPVIRKGKGRKVKMGQRARLGCYANGKPPPKFYWTRSGVPVTSGSKGIVIRSTNTSSLLIVRKVRSAHIGEYVCKAENAIGESEKALLLEVNKQTQSSKPKYNVRNAPDKRVCDRVVCLNGGTCYYSPSLDLSFCKCTKGFEGVKCENDISGPEVPHVTTKPLKNVSDPVDNPPSEQLSLNNSMGNISETSASRSRTKFSPSLDGIKSNETTHHSVYNNSTSQSSRDMLTTPLATMSLYANEGTSTPETTRFPGSDDTQTQTPEPRKHRKDTRENTSTSKFRPISNVDDAALKLILSRLADNQLKSSQCSPTFHDFCENGGTCSYVLVLDVTVCICPAGFNGSRCQTTFQQKQDFDSNSLKENRTFSNEVGNNTDIIASFSEQTRVSDRERNSVANLKDRIKAHTPKPGKGNRSSRKYQATNKRQLKSKNESKVTDCLISNGHCLNGGTCRNLTSLSRLTCLCPPRFQGERCEILSYPCSRTQANLCFNGGTCYYSVALARIFCRCAEGFTGQRCEASDHSSELGVRSSGLSPHKVKGTLKKRPSPEISSEIISRLRNGRIKASRCKSKGFCLNKGKCRYIHKLAQNVCICRAGYTGQRCQEPASLQ